MAIIYILGLIAIFYLLAKICDEYFIESLEIIQRKLKLSEDVAGATFMAIGTSAPEFFTAVSALIVAGAHDVGAGTIVGSAIFNILVIVGGASIVAKKAQLTWQPTLRDMSFYLLSIVLLFFTFRDGSITLIEASLYLVLYAIYIFVLARWRHLFPHLASHTHTADILEGIEEEIRTPTGHPWLLSLSRGTDVVMSPLFPNLKKNPHLYGVTFSLPILWIIVLSMLLVKSGVGLAEALGVPQVIIALTILAGGTSIPDLLASLIVAKKKRGDMAVSNAVGSNTFDILICLGLPWVVAILVTGKALPVSTEGLLISVLLLFGTVVLMLLMFILRKFQISRGWGFILLGVYGLYLLYTIIESM